MTFNIRGMRSVQAEEIVSAIVDKNPDVVLFHDVDTDKQRSGLVQIDYIRRRVDEETRKARGSCFSSDVVFGAEVRTSANAIMTRNGFTIAAGEEVEAVPVRTRDNGRVRLSDVPPALVAVVKAPSGHSFSIVSTMDQSNVPNLTRQAREQSRTVLTPSAVLIDDQSVSAATNVEVKLSELTLS